MKYTVKERGATIAYNGLPDIKDVLEQMGMAIRDDGDCLYNIVDGECIGMTDWLLVTDYSYEIISSTDFHNAYVGVVCH